MLRRPRAEVEIKAKAGSTVLLDGRNMGKAPIVLKDALPGNHWIRVEKPGAPVQVKKLRIRSKRTTVVEFEGAEAAAASAAPVGVLGAIASNSISREHLASIRRSGRKANADFVMFGGIYRTGTAYNIHTAMLDVGSGKIGRLQGIAFDLDMLTAEIEVFKLAADAKKQATAGTLAKPVDDEPLVLAPKKRAPSRRRAVGGKVPRVATAIAAPPPMKKPKSLYAAAGRAPAGAAPEEGGGRVAKPVVKSGPKVLPKDELAAKPQPKDDDRSLTSSGSLVLPKDEKKDDDDGSLWWVWLLVGVAAAGAAGATTAVVASGQSSDSATLTVTW